MFGPNQGLRFAVAWILLTIVVPAPGARGADELQDPTFDAVASRYPAMKRPREVIGVKEHRDEFIVMPDARIAFTPSREGYYWRGYVAVNSGRAFFTVDDETAWIGSEASGLPARKRLADGYLPIVIADFERVAQFEPGLKYEQTAAAWSKEMSPDEPIWAFVRMKVSNEGDSERQATLHWNVDYGAKVAESFVEKRAGKPHKDNLKARKVASWRFKLAPGAERSVYAKLPYLDGYERAEESTAEEFDMRLAEVSAFWKSFLNKGIRITVPEERVNDACRAWLAYTFLNVDKIGDMYEPHDGSGFYECILGIMAAKFCNALGLMGYPDEAQKYLDSLGTLISPEGQFKVGFGSVDTGVLLLAMAHHARLSGDEAWLRRAAPRMLKMCEWIIAQRKEAKAQQESGSLCYGLIKSNLGVDNAGAYYSYVTDAALCVGMEAAARALRALGMTRDAARIEAEGLAYRRDIVQSMDRAVIQQDGLRILPVMPDTHKYLKRAAYKAHTDAPPGQGYTGHGYYSLFSCILLETKFLPADDGRFRLITELLERRKGLLMSMCAFGPEGGIDHAFTYGYWMNCLERNRVEPVLHGFYGSLAYGMSRDTWAGVELTNMHTGANAATLPHLRSGVQQMRLLRNMLLREQGNELILAQAVPQHWLHHGKQVRVENAPTLFGKAGYAIDSHVGEGRIRVAIDAPTGRNRPDALKLYLRHPGRKAIKGVNLNGAPVNTFSDDNVTLKCLEGPAVVDVDYR